MITLQIDNAKELLNDFSFNEGMETKKNIQYIKDNFNKIIKDEVEAIKELINREAGSFAMMRAINDNRGSGFISDNNGEELGKFYYRADVKL